MFFKNKYHRKNPKDYLKRKNKKNIKGNIFEDETDLQEKVKDDIEGQKDLDGREEDILVNQDLDTVQSIDEIDSDNPLKKLLKRLFRKKKRRKEQLDEHIRTDLDPALRNKGLKDKNIARAEDTRSTGVISSISNALIYNNIRNMNFLNQKKTTLTEQEKPKPSEYDRRDLNRDGVVSDEEKEIADQVDHQVENLKFLADVKNNIGENKGKGKWVADHLKDSHIKGGDGRNK